MKVKVVLKNLRTAPRKVRLVADLVRGKNALEAQSLLSFTVNKSAESVLKLLNSALSTAKNDFKLQEENLVISEIRVDEGPTLKRWHPMSRGRAFPIMKRSSHVMLSLSEGKTSEKIEKKEIKKTVKKVDKKEEKKLESNPKKEKVAKKK